MVVVVVVGGIKLGLEPTGNEGRRVKKKRGAGSSKGLCKTAPRQNPDKVQLSEEHESEGARVCEAQGPSTCSGRLCPRAQ